MRIEKNGNDERIVIRLRRIGECNGCMINESMRAWKGRWACLKLCSGRAMGDCLVPKTVHEAHIQLQEYFLFMTCAMDS